VKRSSIKLLALAGSLSFAVATYAANHTQTGEGQEGNTFWTVFKSETKSGGVNVTNSNSRTATISWVNRDDPAADFVGGVGWKDVNFPNTITYNVTNFTWPTSQAFDSRGVFGVYGWSCGINQGVSDKNIEFYIVDNWLGANQYIPYDGSTRMTPKETVRANGADYKIYQSSTYNRANACGPGLPNFQVWAVRQGKRTLSSSANNVDFKTIGGVMSKYGYFTQNLRYLVVGVDVFQNASGSFRLGYVNKN
jgi:hypothetical protein